MLKFGKKVFYIFWGLLIVYLLLLYLLNPEIVTPHYVITFMQSFGGEVMIVYIVLTLIRGFFLIPSTPFVLTGGMLFSDELFLVLAISMAGIVASATMLYYFSDILGFSDYLEKRHPDNMNKWKNRLGSPKAMLFVIAWSFFPLAPTDLICYVAGIVKMPYKLMITGVFLGELVLNVFYIYFAASII